MSDCEQRRVPQKSENMSGFRWRPEVTWKPLPDQQDAPVQGLHCWTLSFCPGNQEPLGRGAGHPLSGPRGHGWLGEQTAEASRFHPIVQSLSSNWSPSRGQMSQGWGLWDRKGRDWQAGVWGQGRARGLLQLDREENSLHAWWDGATPQRGLQGGSPLQGGPGDHEDGPGQLGRPRSRAKLKTLPWALRGWGRA